MFLLLSTSSCQSTSQNSTKVISIITCDEYKRPKFLFFVRIQNFVWLIINVLVLDLKNDERLLPLQTLNQNENIPQHKPKSQWHIGMEHETWPPHSQ